MFSLQRLLGRPAEFFGLLEQSAALGAESVSALRNTLSNRTQAPSLDAFVNARRKDKAIINRLEEMLTKVFVTPIESFIFCSSTICADAGMAPSAPAIVNSDASAAEIRRGERLVPWRSSSRKLKVFAESAA